MADPSLTIAVVTAIGAVSGLLLKFLKDRSLATDIKRQGSTIAELREDLETQLRTRKTFVPQAHFARVLTRVNDLERQVNELRNSPDMKDMRARIEELQRARQEADRQWSTLMREIGELSGQVTVLASDRS